MRRTSTPNGVIIVRVGTTADAEAICSVHRRAILELGPTSYSAEACASWAAGTCPGRYAAAMTEGGETFLLAEDASGAVRGFCSFKEDEVRGLYIDPDVARRGLGALLLAEAEAVLLRRGVPIARLGAALSAARFYEAQGYRVVRRKPWTTRGGLVIEALDMVKPLRPPD